MGIVKMAKRLVLMLIKAYQLARICRPACCRFYPSCSDYSLQAIENHGLINGFALTVKRLLKCHPWHEGGIDVIPSVPPRFRRSGAGAIEVSL
jgi:putative membrane protein insertion efficiency factor